MPLTSPLIPSLPRPLAERLTGPGAPFEMTAEDVLGAGEAVFARRSRHVAELLQGAARRLPERAFLVFPDRTFTYAGFVDLAGRAARRLTDEHGVRPGDRVAIAAANSAAYAVMFWGAVFAGAVNVGLNGWWTGDELRHGIELTTPVVVFADAPRADRLAAASVDAKVYDLEAAAGGLELLDPLALVGRGEDHPLLILFTSGTTGRPKGAVLSHRNFLHFAQTTALQGAAGLALAGVDLQTLPPPITVGASPFFHISGVLALLTAASRAETLVFAAPGRWDAGRHLQLTEQHRVTSWSAVPTQFWRLLQHPDFGRYDLSSLRTVSGGGAVFAPELIRLIGERLPHVVPGTGYGMTETAGMGATISGPLYRQHPDSLGVPNPTAQIEIRDLDGTVLPEGEIGEIHIKHAAVFAGYWNDPVATARALGAGRWYATGDFGRIDGGLLYLESRIRDLIIRGGENIYPIEIENRLVEHPDIDDTAVVGVDHPTLGQEVKAVIVVRPGRQLSAAAVQRWVGERLAHFKVPAHVVFVDELPRTANGKVLKHELA